MQIYFVGNLNDEYNINGIEIVAITAPITFRDANHFTINSELIEFDYLIIGNVKLITNIDDIELMHDNSVLITNYFQQTNLEHIFAINDGDIREKLYKIVNFILNIDI